MPQVSVIIPAYNPSMFLLDCIKSVLAQTRLPDEVVVVNDGSSVGSQPIFEALAKDYPSVMRINVPSNKGVAHARNLGVRGTTGEYITFIDQDDLWAANKLERQLDYMQRHEDVDYITSRQRYFLSDGVQVPPSWVPKHQIDVSLPGFLPGTLMVRRGAFEALEGFDESLTAGTDDVDWFFRAKQAGLITHEIAEELLLKRIHQGNLSMHAREHNQELLSVVKQNILRRRESA